MNLLVVTNAFPPNIIGGGEFSASNLVRVLCKNGHRVSVLTMAEPSETELWDAPMPGGYSMFRLHFPREFTPYKANKGDFKPGYWHWKVWNIQDFLDPRGVVLVKKVLDCVQPEHINIHSISGFGYNVVAALGEKSTITWILHDLSLSCAKGGMFVNRHSCVGQCLKCKVLSHVKSYFIGKAPNLVFISPSKRNLATVQRYTPVVKERPGFAIPNIPDLLPADMPAYQADLEGRCRILFVGRLHETKGIDLLLEALRPLAAVFDFTVTIFGRGPQEAELKAAYGAMPWCTFGGWVSQDDITRAVATHDLLCTPSIWAEPYGRVTAQALQLGTPVIGSNIGGTVELIRHEETGLLVEPGNVSAWREAFVRILSNPMLVTEWRKNTLKYAHEFDEQAIADRYEEVIAIARGLRNEQSTG